MPTTTRLGRGAVGCTGAGTTVAWVSNDSGAALDAFEVACAVAR